MPSAPGNRLALHEWRYSLLAGMLLVVLIGVPLNDALSVSPWVTWVLLAFLTIACVWAVGFERRAVLVTMAGLFIGYNVLLVWRVLAPSVAVEFSSHVAALVFYALIAVRIFVEVLRRRDVTLDLVMGAVAIYFLLGIMWSRIYMMIELGDPGAFVFAPHLEVNTLSAALGDESTLTYFSFVTLSTLGYGDVTPASALAQRAAMLQAVIGQLYIAITVARLVGMYTATSMAKKDHP